MNKKKLIGQLKSLEKRLKYRARKYNTAHMKEKEDLFARNRYEGIANGSRWAHEDLHFLIESIEKGTRVRYPAGLRD